MFLALVLVSCNKKEYTNAIPKDASFVAQLNMAKIYNDMDLSHSPVMTTMHSYLNFMVFDRKSRTQLSDYLDNPETMGIDFTQPLYFFKAGTFMGLAMQISDRDDIDGFFGVLQKQHLCTKPKEKDGLMVGALLNEIAVVYSDKSMLMLFNSDGGSISFCQKAAQQMISQKSDASFGATPAYDKLESQTDNDVVCYGNIKALPAEFAGMLKAFFPKKSRTADVDLYTIINIEDGNLDIDANMDSDTEEGKAAIEGFNANIRTIEGRYVSMPYDDSYLWASAGVKGDVLLDVLRSHPELRQKLIMAEAAIDIEQIMRSVDGDVAVASGAFPEMTFAAKVASKDFLKDVDYWTQHMKEYGVTMTRRGTGNDYTLIADSNKYLWGVKDDNFYISTEKMKGAGTFTGHSNTLIPIDEVKGSRLYVYMNVAALRIPYLSGFESIRIKLK